MKVSVFFVIYSLLTRSVAGKYVEGHLKTLDDWAFVARFCFISEQARYEFQIDFERKYGEPSLLLYYDDKSQWPAVYKTDKTCEQKLSVLSVANNQIVTLSVKTPYNDLSGCSLRSSLENDEEAKTLRPQMPPEDPNIQSDELEPEYFDQFLETSATTEEILTSPFTDVSLDNDSTTVHSPQSQENRGRIIVSCRNAIGFASVKERWWYIAISNCGSSEGLDIKYRFKMTNGPPGDFWHEHFSADEMYIPPILLTQCLAYSFLLLGIVLCAIKLKSRYLFHCTYCLFTFSAFAQWAGILAQGVAWARYAVSGLGPNTVLGAMLMGASEVSFLALMLLMAKGYTITRARLSTGTTVKLTVFISVYIVAYISLYIIQAETFDPGEMLNIYESPAGFGLIGLRCAAWVAFVIGVAATLRKYPGKRAFYYPFGLLGSVWILSGPALMLVGIGVLDTWVRESVMCAILGIVAFGGHAAFLWLTWPSRANRSFSYNVRTNHVGVANTDDGTDYPRHPYEPTAMQHEQNIIPNATGPSSGHDTPVRDKTGQKSNPFLVNGQQRQPNKVILEPIEQPLRGYIQDT